MKKIFTTLLGLTLLFGSVSCSSDKSDDLDKAKIEAKQKAKAEAEKKAKEEGKKKAKAEAEKKAKAEAKQKAIKSLKEAEDLATLNSLFDALSEDLKVDAEVLKAKEDRKTELEKQKALTWLEGKTFVAKQGDENFSSVRTLIFKDKLTFVLREQIGQGDELMDSVAPIEGTYKYIKPTLRLSWLIPDIYGGAGREVSLEYEVDEAKNEVKAEIDGEIVVFKLVK